MLFWIFVIAAVVSAIFWIFIAVCKNNSYSNSTPPCMLKVANWVYDKWYADTEHYIVIGTFVISLIVAFFMSLFVIDAQVNKESNTQAYLQRYESLVWELENVNYDNDNDLGKKELYTQIRDYNVSVAKGKVDIENIWITPFVNADYRDVPLIDLKTQ